MTDQLALVPDSPAVPAHRVAALAGVLAGFRWPGRGTFDNLTKRQKEACLAAARGALETLAREAD